MPHISGNTVVGDDIPNNLNDTIDLVNWSVANASGGQGNDKLTGDARNNTIDGGSGDDEITGGKGFDILNGGDGNDTFYVTPDWNDPNYNQIGGYTAYYADDVYSGGAGNDRIRTQSNNLTLVLDGSNRLVLDSIEAIDGSNAANFRVSGTAAGNIFDFTNFQLYNVLIDGNVGDDIITGSSANGGYSGNDRLEGGYGFDTLIMHGSMGEYGLSIDQGMLRITDLTTSGVENTGSDLISGFERLEFDDGVVDIAPGTVSDTDGAANAVTENAAAGTQIGIDLFSAANSSLATLFGSATPTYQFSTGSNTQQIFAIDAVTGVVTVANSSLLTPANAQLLSDGVTLGFTIVVESTFAGTVSTPVTFEIALTPMPGTAPQTPYDADTTNADAVTENAATGTYTGLTVHADDLEGDTVTYSLVDNAGGRFQIDASTGAVTVLDGSLIDYEAQNYWAINVRASDGTRYTDQQFYIMVNDQVVEVWNGTAGADTYTVSSGGDWLLNGGAGADTLVGIGGNDILIGGDGNDSLIGLGGNDTFQFSGSTGGLDNIFGGDGYDTVQATAANTVIGVNSLLDVEAFSANGFSNVSLQFGASNDMFDASTAGFFDIPIIRAGAGDDSITGTIGNETILGEDGADTIEGGYGADTLNGGTGIDTLSYSTSYAGVNINLATNVVSGGDADGDIVTAFENVTGSAFDDILTGSTAANILTGGAGNDTMDGGSGNDTFRIGLNSGTDAIIGGSGTDTILFTADNAVLSLTSIATVEAINATGITNATIAGTSDNNTLSFSATTLTNITGIYGLEGNDTITGSAGNDIIIGGAGNDTLNGGNGNDTFRYLGGDEGSDVLNGGAGTDTIEVVNGGTVIGLTSITAIEAINGVGDTVITGTAAANTLNFTTVALSGIASINGGDGNDTITGSAGDDVIYGGNGVDRLAGGVGYDYLVGDAGNDIFDFNAVGESTVGSWADIIGDFVAGQDKIDVNTIDANSALAGDQNFTFIGAGAFSGVAGQLRYDNGVGDGFTHIFGDVNGDMAADFEVRVYGTYTLASTNFVL